MGVELSSSYYSAVVRPIALDIVGAAHSAARIDDGSEVLGFDDEMSRDHSWGPRLLFFLPEDSNEELAADLDRAMRERLPIEFGGYSTSFKTDESDDGSLVAAVPIAGEIDHFIKISTLSSFLSHYIGMSSVDELSDGDWLSLPSQKLLTLSTGPVFHDGIANGVGRMQEDLRFYPEHVWMYLMATEWTRLAQEEPFIGRTGIVGDEIGSSIVASRLLKHAMRLAFLMESTYAPYSKWFGSAFMRLSCSETLGPLIEQVQVAPDWNEREVAFVGLVSFLGEMHNELGVTESIDPNPRSFHDRPFNVVDSERFASALKSASLAIRSSDMWKGKPIGGIDTFSDSTDLLTDTSRRSGVAGLFD